MGGSRAESVTARIDRPFLLVLIGLRWAGWRHWGAMRKARRQLERLLAELDRDPDSGLLGWEHWPGRNPLWVQYWRSFDDLERWARAPGGAHRQVWTEYLRGPAKRGAVGIWHEAYMVEPGSYEAVYTAMPALGLARVGEVLEARGRLGRARGRLSMFEKG